MKDIQLTPTQRRLVYAIRDFEIAHSASIFLSEIDFEEKFSPIEIRRFNCLETAMITSYWRPFSCKKTEKELRKYTEDLSPDSVKTHNEIKIYRDKVFAHSDRSHQRFRIKNHLLKISSTLEEEIYFPLFIFDYTLKFNSNDIYIISNNCRHFISSICDQIGTDLKLMSQPIDIYIECDPSNR